MNHSAAVSPPLSLCALRGAVGEVVGSADDLGCWDRVVSIWRIFWALDGLIAVLWAIVHRLRCQDGLVVAEAAGGARAVVAGLRPVRVRAVAGRRVVTGAVASVGRVPRVARARVDWGPLGRGLTWRAPVLAVRGPRFSELGWVCRETAI